MDKEMRRNRAGWPVLAITTFCIFHYTSHSNASFGQVRKRMPEPLNLRDHVEYAPSISADGQTLIFQSDRYGLFVNANKKVPRINAEGNQQIIDDKLSTEFFGVYEAHRHPSGQWIRPESINTINRYDSGGMTPLIGGPSISYDGNYLFFFANFPTKSGFGREDIYYCVRQRDGWGPPVNMGAMINTAGYEGFPSISGDGRSLYFVRENLTNRIWDGQTCYRIMVSEKGRDGQWKRPIELPPPVNLDCEKAPRIMADSRTIVYSSIKAKGEGNFDLYMSTMQPDGSWSEPKNLQYVNTRRSDQSVAISACGDVLYYVSDGDIYTTSIPDELRPFKLATVQGFVTDSLTGAPLSARVVVTDVASGTVVTTVETNPADGRYTVLLPVTSGCRLTVNERDFRAMSRAIDRTLYLTCTVIPQDFRLKTVRTETLSRADGRPSASRPADARNADDIVIMTEPTVTDSTRLASAPAIVPTATMVFADSVARRPLTPPESSTGPTNPAERVAQAADGLAQSVSQPVSTPPVAAPVNEVVVGPEPVVPTAVERLSASQAAEKRTSTLTLADSVRKLQAPPMLAVTVRVVDSETGETLPSVRLTMLNEQTQAALTPVADSAGQGYGLSVPPGLSLTVKASVEGYQTANARLSSLNAPQRLTMRLMKLTPSVLIINVFAMKVGRPLPSAVVAITSKASGKTEQFTLTGGPLERTFATPDELMILVSAPGYTSVNRPLRVDVPVGGKRYEFDAELDRITTTLLVRAVDSETGKAIPGVRFTLNGADTKPITLITDPATGIVTAELPGKATYQLVSIAEGYEAFSRTLTVDKEQNEVLVKLAARPVPAVVKPEPVTETEATVGASDRVASVSTKAFGVVEKGKSIQLNKLYFDQSSPVLRPESYTELDQLHGVLAEHPSMRIEIRGHTDNQGDFDANVQLSRDRCQSVVDYLAGKGIRKNRLKAVGRGPTEPVAPNNNEENRRKNRRVEFMLL